MLARILLLPLAAVAATVVGCHHHDRDHDHRRPPPRYDRYEPHRHDHHRHDRDWREDRWREDRYDRGRDRDRHDPRDGPRGRRPERYSAAESASGPVAT